MPYDNTNSGSLFKNREKTAANPNWPDHKGSAEIKCPHCGKNSEHWLSAWIKVAGAQSKIAGQRFFSMAFEPKDTSTSNMKPSPDNPHTKGEDFDDIPF